MYGAAHSCSSFADLVLKSLQVVKEKLALTTYQLFMTRSAKLEQLWAAPPLYRIVILLYCTPDLTKEVPPGGT